MLFNPKLPIIIAADASPDGLGAVLSHVYENGEETPVYFASRTLTAAEKNYSQLDREAAAIIFAIRKFYKFVYGHRFIIYTDHRPLISIFNEKKLSTLVLSPRMLRWQGLVSSLNCDGFSRLPIEDPNEEQDDISINAFHRENDPINYEIVRSATQTDRELTKLKQIIIDGWLDNSSGLSETLTYYWKFRLSLTVEDECIYYGFRILIPRKLRRKVLYILHETHVGVVRMKMMARSLLWWRGIDADIEKIAGECEECNVTAQEKQISHSGIEATTFPFVR